MNVALCLLTLNERPGCERDLPRLPREVFSELFAIDGGSTDGTIEYLRAQGVEVIAQQRPGLNGACWDASERCRSEAIIFYHPKGTTEPTDVLAVLQALREGTDLVIASRNCQGGRNEEDDHWFRPRKWFVRFLALVAAARWRREGPVVQDVLHGFRGVRVEAFRAMNPPTSGFTIDLAMVVAAYRLRLSRRELPVRETRRWQGETHFKALPTGCRLLAYLLQQSFSTRSWLLLVALLTVLAHGTFGSWYWEQWVGQHMAPSAPPRQMQEEAYRGLFTGWNGTVERDSAAYHRAALAIQDSGVPRSQTGHVYWRAPLYPYLLALGYGVGGWQHWSYLVPQALLSGLTCWLVGLAALNWTRRAGPAILAAVLVLVNARFAMYTGYVYPTVLVMFCMALAAWAATRLPRRGAGLVFAVALLAATFAQAAFFILALAGAVWLGWQARQQRQRSLALVALALAGLVVVKFWLSTRSQDSQARLDRGILWEGNNPAYAQTRWHDAWRREPSADTPPATRAKFDQQLQAADNDPQRAARQWIAQNPGQYLTLCAVRLRTALGPHTGEMSRRNRWVGLGLWLLLFPAAALSCRRLWPDPVVVWLLLSSAAYAAFAALVIEDWYLRYRIPLEILLTLVAVGVFRKRVA